jgi:PHD/YefM family antitoxin component YafN of YafNO toxin-antitoxin module
MVPNVIDDKPQPPVLYRSYLSMKDVSLTQARAKLSTLASELDKGKGPVAIAQRSKVKAMLVGAEWHSRVEEELAHY